MFRNIVITLYFVILAGCAGSPARIGMMSPEELRAENSYNLCNAYAFDKSEKSKNELIRREAIPKEEWPIIEQKKIIIGMSELGLICSWGLPGIDGNVNKTVTAGGVRKQWVYRGCRVCKGKYVYTENGKITGWQN